MTAVAIDAVPLERHDEHAEHDGGLYGAGWASYLRLADPPPNLSDSALTPTKGATLWFG